MTTENSLIYPTLITGMFSADECAEIIKSVQEETFEISTVWYHDKKESNSSVRKGPIFWLSESDERFKLVYNRISLGMEAAIKYYDFDCTGIEMIQLCRYEVGDYFNWHFDLGSQKEISHRKISLVVSLSDPDAYKGGHLEFYDYSVEKPIAQGFSIAFPSYLRHRVTPLKQGVRYSLVSASPS